MAAVLTIPVTVLQLLPAGDPWRTIADVLNWMIWLTFLAEVVVMPAVVPPKGPVAQRPPAGACDRLADATVRGKRRPVRVGAAIAEAAAAGAARGHAVENHSLGHGIYWPITTMTTVGCGDIAPGTPQGKVIAVAVRLVGTGFATLVIGAMAERFIHHQVRDVELSEDEILKEARDISARLGRLEQALERRRTGH